MANLVQYLGRLPTYWLLILFLAGYGMLGFSLAAIINERGIFADGVHTTDEPRKR